MSYYQSMKKSRSKATQKIRERMENEQANRNNNPNQWKLSRDKADNGYAMIRFLPASEKDFLLQQKNAAAENVTDFGPDDAIPWVLRWKHGFKHNGKWLIAECPRTIEKDCPICEIEKDKIENGIGWDQAFRQHPDRVLYSQRKGKKEYWSNILIIDDKAHPENNGKVMMFSYGEKLHEKIMRAMKPQFDDEIAINPFDPWDGANFKLKAMRKDGYINYDSSSFTDQSPIADDDDEIFAILAKSFFLSELVDPKIFKDYDKLLKDYERVVNGKTTTRTNIEDEPDKEEAENERQVNESTQQKERETHSSEDYDIPFEPDKKADRSEPDTSEDGGDDMEYFQSLLDEDED